MAKEPRLQEYRYIVDKDFDQLQVFTMFAPVNKDKYGNAIWPEKMKPSASGTPKHIYNHMQKVRKEADARDRRGEDDQWYVSLKVGDVRFTGSTILFLYYIEEVALGTKKSFPVEGLFYV